MAAKVMLMFNGERVDEFLLDKESVTIGRRPTSDIYIDNLAVSGNHARILTILDDSYLEDLDSTNGVFVNGQRVKRHALQEGDVVTIGKHELYFFADTESKRDTGGEDASALHTPPILDKPARSDSEPGRVELDPIIEPSPVEPPLPEPATQAAESAETLVNAKLRVLTERGTGKELPLVKAITTVGKPGVQVAAISRRPQGDFIVNVERSEGAEAPLVNGAPLGHRSLRLEHQDVIEIAGVKMEYLKE